MKRLKEDGFIFSIGGITYGLIELLWRRYTHWTMIITGGVCFLLLYRCFAKMANISLFKKCLTGSLIITIVELIVGCIVNLQFKLHVWDYSNLPLNLWGQVSLLYSALWGVLTIPICFLCNKMKAVVKKI
ncbi:MAG TPA: hypothetical protein GX401_01090 [Clostridiales bacterium]|nr:hypothetical protein [Clostridiales bacterium]